MPGSCQALDEKEQTEIKPWQSEVLLIHQGPLSSLELLFDGQVHTIKEQVHDLGGLLRFTAPAGTGESHGHRGLCPTSAGASVIA